jgi:hypothetical protein
MTLVVVHDLAYARAFPSTEPSPTPLGRHLARVALIVVALGILPFVLQTGPLWRVLGTLVAVAMVLRSAQLVWRAAFSTDPRHLASY